MCSEGIGCISDPVGLWNKTNKPEEVDLCIYLMIALAYTLDFHLMFMPFGFRVFQNAIVICNMFLTANYADIWHY